MYIRLVCPRTKAELLPHLGFLQVRAARIHPDGPIQAELKRGIYNMEMAFDKSPNNNLESEIKEAKEIFKPSGPDNAATSG